MTKPIVRKGLEALADGQDVEALRRLIVMTVISRYLAPSSAHDDSIKDDSLSALLSRLPTKHLSAVASISKGKTGIKDARPGTFPLVVTAESRSSTDHFDFEGPGVMIPMVSSTGHGDASLKRIHYQDGQYAVGSILAVVQPKDSSLLSARYLHAYLSAFKDELLVSRMVGTANVSLTVAKIGDVPVPLPPIQGQQKIDELMALCDRMEAEQEDAEAAHATLVQTLLGTLTQSRAAAELAANWQRLSQHFDILFTTEASLDALKQTILQLAVMGNLVPQDPNDEPASELLKRIAAEKARLVAEGKIRKDRPLADIETDSLYELPTNWRWASLGSLVKLMDAGWSPACHETPSQDDDTWGVLKTTAVQTLKYLEHENKELPANLDPRPECEVSAGDILITRAGPKNRVAISCLVEKTRPRLMISDKIIRFHLVDGGIFDKFVALCLNAGATAEHLEKSKSGMAVSQMNISQDKLRLAPIPVCSPIEQQRVVAKVDELMALCDSLKADLAESRARQARLATTLIESALQAA